MLYKGSCHCGKIAFQFKAELTGAVRCNCSICSRKGALLCAIPHEDLTVLAWGDDLGTYTFGNHAMAHRFCRTCGIHPFAEDVREGGERSAYVNLNCVADIDPSTLSIFDFDGRSA
ncbi:aldehyde-activating protein [Mesorhizobium erdmanii]|uniref:GFA family protein n=2 Tax=Mesorhizobium TaxID=68287 RepID=A0A3M9X1N2_9HYPH|nr:MULTISPECIES: GFA family protein [Mesorhizobium]RNJ41721.1 GFA family protein [Mesorhizobium japonicum]RXT37639.1 aldehyde-activating protein [Mesorhizobium erdmanii]